MRFINTLRYLFFIPLLMFIGLMTLPLTLLFNWKGFWYLCIANEEGCSIQKAKLLYGKGKYITKNTSSKSCHLSNNSIFSHDPHMATIIDPQFKYLPYNIYNSDN